MKTNKARQIPTMQEEIDHIKGKIQAIEATLIILLKKAKTNKKADKKSN